MQAELRRTFRPEFLNRVDEIVMFRQLGRAQLDRIVDFQIERFRKLLRDKELDIELAPEARTFLADKGYDPIYGARPLKRAIMSTCRIPWPGRSSRAASPPVTSSWSIGTGDGLRFTPKRSGKEAAATIN